MSGHSTLTLINGLIAAIVNIGLNYYFIPIYGAQGAAIATALTLSLWSLWRLIEIWYLLKCFPFSIFNFSLMGTALGLVTLLHFFLSEHALLIRTPIILLLSLLFLLLSFRWGKEKTDEEIAEKIRSKWKRIVSRRKA